jgi:hypothetical protein
LNLEKFKKIVGDQTVDLDLFIDPGHAWLSIPKNLSFGLNFSMYSYQDKTHYYLEEDLDAGLWLDLVHSVGIKTSYTEKITNSDSFIRDLMPIE